MNGDDVVAEYSTNNTSRGIRRFRYAGYPFTYGDAAGQSVHNDGEIYAATMWRLRQLWLDSGRSMDSLWDRVVGGMDHTPSFPAFEDMRDGILTEITDPAEECIVWEAFAQFGIGVGADGRQSAPFSVSESFVKPAACTGPPSNTAPTVTITAPANNSSFTSGTSVTFSGTASDTQDGNLTANLVWTSNLQQGTIGNGGSFSTSTLSVGSHTITASVTDSGGLSGNASRQITITTPSSIQLSTRGFKVKGVQHAELTWSGATSVDVYRNNVKITAAPGSPYTDVIGGKGAGTFTYRVCAAGTTNCSNNSTVVF
jgi:hypothetical protein